MDAAENVADALREQVTPVAIDALLAVRDLPTRSRLLVDAIDAATDLRGRLALARRNTLLEMNAAGMSWVKIGEAIGTTGPRAYQIAHGKNR